jgi:hypothetical protein
VECFGYLKDILYGKTSQPNYDGIHLRGTAASRHFTYRAVNAIKSVFGENRTNVFSKSQSQHNQQYRYQRNYVGTKYEQRKRNNYLESHNNCDQAQYQHRGQLRQGRGSVQTESKRGRKNESVGTQ